MVEYVNSPPVGQIQGSKPVEGNSSNTEPGLGHRPPVDPRALKIYHMAREAEHCRRGEAHRASPLPQKLDVPLARSGPTFYRGPSKN